MSASPTRVVASPSPAELSVPLHAGNRVLESIAQQQALRSLLGFSAFHEQVQQSHRPAQSAASWDLFHTECFVRDEVLQLICDRVQVITQADGVMIAMAEEDGVTCRAASGALLVNRGRSLSYESEFLGQCLYAGRIARSDDCEHDPRVKQDVAVELGARASVLVPLCGRRARIGVLQAFSVVPFSFSDDDVRCLDLFGELILSALKPPDDDRRLHWLAQLADEILRPGRAERIVSDAHPPSAATALEKSVASAAEAATVVAETRKTEPSIAPTPLAQAPPPQNGLEAVNSDKVADAAAMGESAQVERVLVEPEFVEPEFVKPEFVKPVFVEPTPADSAAPSILVESKPVESNSVESNRAELTISKPSVTDVAVELPSRTAPETAPPPVPTPLFATQTNIARALLRDWPAPDDSAEKNTAEKSPVEQEISSPALAKPFTEPAAAETSAPEKSRTEPQVVEAFAPAAAETTDAKEPPAPFLFSHYYPASDGDAADDVIPEEAPPLPFFHRIAIATSARPGLSVVMILVLVPALFSTGVWWGMRGHGFGVSGMFSAARQGPGTTVSDSGAVLPVSVPVTPSVPKVADNLDPMTLDSPGAPLSPAPPSKLAVFPKITGVRHWSSAVASTVAIDMEDQVPYEVHRLTSPERIYFDLHDTALAAQLDGKTIDVGDASLTRVRIAQPVAGVTRLVLDTRDGSNFSVSMESNPYRLVVQVRPSGSERTVLASRTSPSALSDRSAAATALTPVTRPTENVPASQARTGHFRIVLDAGHGGWDLGTVGREGLMEKDLVLDVAQRLGRLLKSRLGADVVYTRTGDDYLPLDQRAELANQAQADLFVSVHANYSSLATARGVETYYSNFYVPPATRELDKPDSAASAHLVPAALSPGELHAKVEDSRSLASSVQRSLFGTLAATNPGIRDRGIKDASFVVLKGTTMPSILTEISFVSSPADERNLRSEAYRQQIAEALYKGISRYEAGSQKVKLAQVPTKAGGK